MFFIINVKQKPHNWHFFFVSCNELPDEVQVSKCSVKVNVFPQVVWIHLSLQLRATCLCVSPATVRDVKMWKRFSTQWEMTKFGRKVLQRLPFLAVPWPRLPLLGSVCHVLRTARSTLFALTCPRISNWTWRMVMATHFPTLKLVSTTLRRFRMTWGGKEPKPYLGDTECLMHGAVIINQ